MRELCRARGHLGRRHSQGKERVWVASESQLFSLKPPAVEVGESDSVPATAWRAGNRRRPKRAGTNFLKLCSTGIAAAAENVRYVRFPPGLTQSRVQGLRKQTRHDLESRRA